MQRRHFKTYLKETFQLLELIQTLMVNKNKDYEGKVSRIERMTKDSGTGTGIGIEITLDKPDSDIILG